MVVVDRNVLWRQAGLRNALPLEVSRCVHRVHEGLRSWATALKVVAWVVLALGVMVADRSYDWWPAGGPGAARRGMEQATRTGTWAGGVTGGMAAFIMSVIWFLIHLRAGGHRSGGRRHLVDPRDGRRGHPMPARASRPNRATRPPGRRYRLRVPLARPFEHMEHEKKESDPGRGGSLHVGPGNPSARQHAARQRTRAAPVLHLRHHLEQIRPRRSLRPRS